MFMAYAIYNLIIRGFEEMSSKFLVYAINEAYGFGKSMQNQTAVFNYPYQSTDRECKFCTVFYVLRYETLI